MRLYIKNLKNLSATTNRDNDNKFSDFISINCITYTLAYSLRRS